MTAVLPDTARTTTVPAVPAATTTTATTSGAGPARLSRAAAAALVVGAALNTGQALLSRSLGGADSPAAQLADADAHPRLTLLLVLGGMLGVVLLLPGLRAAASLLRPRMPRTATAASLLTGVGTLGFLGLHVLMLVSWSAASFEDREAAVALLEHLREAPVFAVVLVPFLLGMFGGLLVLTVGLLRTRAVPRWAPVCWALFLPVDLVAAGASPVDPHWLFLAGAVGVAVAGRSPAAVAAPAPAKA